MEFSKIVAGFPPGIRVPAELELLCKWVQENGYPISGLFKLSAQSYTTLHYWFGHDRVVSRFGIFGAGSDGTMYCVWQQDDGQEIIVYLESEGDRGVLTKNFRDFLRLLAIGYGELFIDDLTLPPTKMGAPAAFQQWVTETFQVTIPQVGNEITLPARETCQDIDAWIERV